MGKNGVGETRNEAVSQGIQAWTKAVAGMVRTAGDGGAKTCGGTGCGGLH